MLFPLPTFDVREYGSALEEGFLCPDCRSNQLQLDEQTTKQTGTVSLRCPACGGLFKAGWRRHHYAGSHSQPKTLSGSLVQSLGGFYQTIQAYPVKPEAGVREEDTVLLPHLADFVIDLDRDDMRLAQLDAETVFDYLENLAPNQTRIYYSGSKGFHLVLPWQALGAVPDPYLSTRIYRRMASIIHSETTVEPDYMIYSPSRMLRYPDSWHPKTGRYKVELTPEELKTCTAYQLTKLASAPRGKLNTTRPVLAPQANKLYQEAVTATEQVQKKFGDCNTSNTIRFDYGTGTPPCVAVLLDKGLPSTGSRHSVYLMLARYWKSAGVPLTSYNAFDTLDRNCALFMGRDYASRDSRFTDTYKSIRVRDMEACLRYAYESQGGFKCHEAQAMGICSDTCPIKQVSSHPLAGLLGMTS